LALKPKLALIEKHIDENSQITNMLYKSLLQEQAELLLDF
jgi:hypothetical protein